MADPNAAFDENGNPIIEEDEDVDPASNKEGEDESNADEAEKEADKEEADKEDKEDADKESDNPDEEPVEPEVNEDDGEIEVPTRSASQHIIARQKKTIDKMRSDKDTDEEPEENEPEDVNSLIERAIAPLREEATARADEKELRQLFNEIPESENFENRIRAYMKHEVYAGVPPTVIYHHLAFKAAEKAGAVKKEAADLEADQTKGGGRTVKPKAKGKSNAPTEDEVQDMTDADVDALKNKVLANR